MDTNQQQDLNALIKRRYEELEELKQKNFEPYAYSFDVDSNSKEIKDNFDKYENKDVKIAGRIMAIRRMGKASFTVIQDNRGKIQLYLRKDELGDSYTAFKLLDIGDIIGIEGFVFKTKTGETSVHAKALTVLSKSLRPIPIPKEVTDEEGNKKIYDQFTDKELRYRQRYVDLIVNPEIKDAFLKAVKNYYDYAQFPEQPRLSGSRDPNSSAHLRRRRRSAVCYSSQYFGYAALFADRR